jgi:hypothetical protein
MTVFYHGSKPFPEWCGFRGISTQMGYKLRREGRGPRVDYVGRKPTVSGEAEAEWHQARQNEANRNSETESAA